MGNLVLAGATSGSITLEPTAVAGSNTLTLPASTGTLLIAGTQNIPKAALPTGSVLQVVSATKTDTFSSSTTNSWLDVTGISVSITPISSSSKIMVFGRITGMGEQSATRMQMRLVRDSTAISIGDAAGSRTQVSGNELYVADTSAYLGSVITFLDSPSTTSATTYKIQVRNGNGSGTIYVNRTQDDTDNIVFPRGTSSITVMEIAA